MRPTGSREGKLEIVLLLARSICFICLLAIIISQATINLSLGVVCSPLQESDSKSVASSYPSMIIGEDGGNYLILSDNEVLQNSDILRHLANTNKEEVEEIVERSPALQASLLNKVQSAIELRESRSKGGQTTAWAQGTTGTSNNHVIMLPDEDELEAGNYENDDENGSNNKKNKKLDSLKSKFKDKATKVFKIGSGLREKLMSMRRKKATKSAPNGLDRVAGATNANNGSPTMSNGNNNNASSWPHFRYSVSTN